MKHRTATISTAVAAALLSITLAGCNGDNPEKMLNSGKEYLAKNDNKAATIEFKNALQKNPNLGEARLLLGKVLLESGDAAGAEVELRKTFELKHAPDQTIPLLAKAMVANGHGKKAIEEFSKTSVAAGEPSAALKTFLSVAYLTQGNRDAARESLVAALAAQPDYAPALLADARFKASTQDLDAARESLERILAKDPKNHEALLMSGVLLAFKGQKDEALSTYRKAIDAKPDFLPAHAAVINQLLQSKQIDEAGKQLDILKKLAPKHPQTIFLDAELSFQKSDFKATRNLSQQLLRLAPNNARALQLAGAAEYQLKSYLQAELYLSKALQQETNLPLARRILVASYLRTGQPAKALTVLQPVLELIERDAVMLQLAGEAHLQNGNPKLAAEYFSKASRLNPEDPRNKTSLALAHMALGNVSSAFEELEQIALTDKGTTADLALIAAYMQNKQPEKAAKAIDTLEKKQPGAPLPNALRAQLLLAKKDVAGARRSFEAALSASPTYFPAAASLASLDMADKKPEDARKRFETVLAADPKNTQALLALAELRKASGGNVEEVATLINKAISASPEEVAPRFALINHYLGAKETKKALTAANDAVAVMPNKPEILDALGRVQQASGDLNQALSTYGKLASMQPASPLAHLRIAEINLANKSNDEATKSLRKALEIKPDLLEAQRGLIALAINAKRIDEAITVTRDIQKQRPKEAIGYILEGDTRASQKAWSEAIAAYRNGLKQAELPELAVKAHSALLASGNEGEAKKLADSWLKEHPKDVVFRMYQGDQASAQKDLALAAQHYRSALEQQPNNPLVLNNLAWVSGQLKQPKALEYAEKANQLSPNQPAFMDTLAMILSDKGETGKAIDLLRKALTRAPQASAIQLNLAKVLMAAGKKEEARKELDELAKQGDRFAGQAEVSRLQKEL